MDKFSRYLKDVWTLTQAIYKDKHGRHLNVSLGNVSGDMDSVVCSIGLGYYLTYKQGFYEEEKDEVTADISDERLEKFYVPLLNMKHADLEARNDIIYHLEQCGIDKDKIPATDVIDLKFYADENKIRVNLVDHNYPDCTQEYLIPFVERIYDHHVVKQADYPLLKEKDIRFCGAAGSLVAKLFLDDADLKDTLLDKEVAKFLYSPILIDTVNFKEKMRGKKWDEIDLEVGTVLKDTAADALPSDYFSQLYNLKTDVETNIRLGYRLLARKDYKNYRINDKILGISTIFISLEDCERAFGAEKLLEEFHDIMEEKGLEMYMVLTHYSVDHEVKRQVLSYAKDKALADKMKELYDTVTQVNLEKIDVGGLAHIENCYTWQNHSTDYSRKKFEPFIREFFEK